MPLSTPDSPDAARARATPQPSVAAPGQPFSASDMHGLARLGVDATLGIVDLVEQMHRTIGELSLPLGRARQAPARGITGLVYRSVRGVTRLAGGGAAQLAKALEPLSRSAPSSAAREAVLAALNGVWGDHLLATANPLAIPMSLRCAGVPVALDARSVRAAWPNACGRVVVLVHGLCMNDLQWARAGHDHGRMLEAQRGLTPVYLHYNTGLHVSDNGGQLAALLERLLALWPVPVTELVILGHSMGGLVARSACHAAEAQGLHWRRALTGLACLGTPHHGAAMERGGHLVETALALSPYSAPFARLARGRSQGIVDLRYGNVQRADWDGVPRTATPRDSRVPTPLPAGVDVLLVAATTAQAPKGLRHAVVGDGLVSLRSALGEHRDPARSLAVPPERKHVILQADHWDLLSHPQAAEALSGWL